MRTSRQTKLPVLPLRDIVIFPNIVVPLYVGRPKSLLAIDEAQKTNKEILLVAQLDANGIDPSTDELYSTGTVAIIKQVQKLSDGNLKIHVEGLERASILSYPQSEPFNQAFVETIASGRTATRAEKLLIDSVFGHFKSYLKLVGKPLDELLTSLEALDDPDKIIDILATQLPFKLKDRQDLLDTIDPETRLEKLASLIMAEIEIIKIDRKIKGRVREQIEKSQKDYYLHEQLSAIQKELGNDGDPKDELRELEKRLAEKKIPADARAKAQKELKRLKTLGGNSAESGVIRTYIDLILDLPWDEKSQDRNDLDFAESVLNADHYGLTEIKERILEFLAVRMKLDTHKSPVICFVGPPGVGKTSLAKSIARSLDRKFERISLGGVRDEAELRGHRRTYIGALPGKILAALKKAGTSNPVILLDEVDKMGTDFRGDPASAMLEILDPEQNKFFTDHYLDLEYDLSKVLFITTANQLETISAPLRDRMEVIRLSGYNEREKVAIAQGYLIAREKANHGMTTESFTLDDDSLHFIIQNYTRESGVRNLQREIGKICRKLVRKTTATDRPTLTLDLVEIEKLLGMPKFRRVDRGRNNEVGVVNGLAWTNTGGEILTVEATVVPGKGRIQITGQLGSVMQESVKAALTYIRSRASQYGIDADYFAKKDVHVHVPEGATPKDGPSAGITIATAILSAVLRIPVLHDIGMTGEITLRGRILPIGGLKEKLLAAERSQLRVVLYPHENERDRKEAEAALSPGLTLIPVDHMDDVIVHALVGDDLGIAGVKGNDRRKGKTTAPEQRINTNNTSSAPPFTTSKH